MRVTFEPPEPIDDERLINAAKGRDDILPQAQAINLLRARRRVNQTQLLTDILTEGDLGPRGEHVALMGLYETNTPESRRALSRLNDRIRNPRMQATLAQVLGRIGGRQDLDTILRIRDQSEGFTRSQAGFAASVLSCRLNLPGYELPFPDAQELLEFTETDDIDSTDVSSPSDEEATTCLRSLADEPFGIDYDRATMYQIKCGPTTEMLLLNKEFSDEGAAEKLRGRKASLGVVALRSPEEDRYSTGFLVFASPKGTDSDEMRLVLHRPSGEQTFAGQLRLEGALLRASVRTVARQGIPAVRFEATYEAGRLNVSEAASAATARLHRIPERG
jgi:hypothetical protein